MIESPPTTFEKSVQYLIDNIPECDKLYISKMKLKPDNLRKLDKGEHLLIELHHTLGKCIRNTFGLWSNANPPLVKELSKKMRETKNMEYHADDASSLIIKELWNRLKEIYSE
tara:strand:- start:27122 stop:27460 length:339 start_codon:yes stop_codon:yes gene_type:complete